MTVIELGAAKSAQPEKKITLLGCALAAISEMVIGVDPGKLPSEIAWLKHRIPETLHKTSAWRGAAESCLGDPSETDAPLVGLGRALGLDHVELLTAALAAAVEQELMVGRALARLQAPLGGSRPTLGLLATAFGEAFGPAGPIDTILNGNAVATGLLVLGLTGNPAPEKTVAMPDFLRSALLGGTPQRPGFAIGISESGGVSLPKAILEEAKKHAAGLTAGSGCALILRSGSTAEAKNVAAAVTDVLGRVPLFILSDETTAVTPWLHISGLTPVFLRNPGPGERVMLPALPCYDGPVLAIAGPDGGVDLAQGAAMEWTIPVPDINERETLWRKALRDDALSSELAAAYRHPSGRIADLARLARQKAKIEGRDAPNREDVRKVAWLGGAGGLGALAQALPDQIADEALVLTKPVERDLGLLVTRCRLRESLDDQLGITTKTRYRPGVRALMVGPSGTGKTLAAGWLATRLGLPLYRVDLASIMSKYIGETEKNLADLLAKAEHAEVVLLFDEADALFGKRTEVKQSNDRFANAQTNYLLQRIETYDGITILTSNSRDRFDPAFTRRLDMIVEFSLPGPNERLKLWQVHLGDNTEIEKRNLNMLAATCDLAGGHIRNVVLVAAVKAKDRGSPITWSDLLSGLAVEYRKLGKQMPVELKRAV